MPAVNFIPSSVLSSADSSRGSSFVISTSFFIRCRSAAMILAAKNNVAPAPIQVSQRNGSTTKYLNSNVNAYL